MDKELFNQLDKLPVSALERIMTELVIPRENELKCTCREDSKQRALCPVCDKEEYDKNQQWMKEAVQDRNPYSASILIQECILQLEYLNGKFRETGTTNSLLAKLKAYLEYEDNN